MKTDHVAIITGGSRGIGRALCLELAGRGGHVYTCARDEAALEELSRQAEGLDGTVDPVVADVTHLEEMSALFERVRDEHGRLDVLVNNAGVLGPRKPIEDVDLADWRTVQSINVDGVFIASKLAIELLRAAESSMILNVSSSVGRRGRGGWGPYAVSKHGVEGLTDTLADELADDGVCVVSVNPGGTATDMRHEAYPDEDPATLPTAEQVAQTFALLIERLDVAQTGRKYNSRDLMDDVGNETNGEDLPYIE
ncbi:MAG: SDR family NAD(P)-dependent oxidoreductase [Persicimonas sp.]